VLGGLIRRITRDIRRFSFTDLDDTQTVLPQELFA